MMNHDSKLWDGSERRSLSSKDDNSKPDKIEHPFWKVMGFTFAALFGGLVWTLSTALGKLDKLNDAQIETKTMVSFLVTQQEENKNTVKDLSTKVSDQGIKVVQIEATLQQRVMCEGRDQK